MNYSGRFNGLNRLLSWSSRIRWHPSLVFAIMIITALFFFEMFNYSTTDFALNDLLGDLEFAGIRWATILAIAFCAIDFAGLARLFTPEQGGDEAKEIWYLFGAWLLAATMNAALTWWGVSMAIVNHSVVSTSVMPPEVVKNIVPVFVAVLVWLIRILIIGTLSSTGDKWLWGSNRTSQRPSSAAPMRRTAVSPASNVSAAPISAPPSTPMLRPASTLQRTVVPNSNRPTPTASHPLSSNATHSEPTYHSMAPKPRNPNGATNNQQQF